MSNPSFEPLTHHCPQCNKLMSCELEQGNSHCWCFDLPPAPGLLEQSSQARCLCRECLMASYAPQQAD